MSACVGQLLGYGVQTFHNAFALPSFGGAIPIDVVRQLSVSLLFISPCYLGKIDPRESSVGAPVSLNKSPPTGMCGWANNHSLLRGPGFRPGLSSTEPTARIDGTQCGLKGLRTIARGETPGGGETPGKPDDSPEHRPSAADLPLPLPPYRTPSKKEDSLYEGGDFRP